MIVFPKKWNAMYALESSLQMLDLLDLIDRFSY